MGVLSAYKKGLISPKEALAGLQDLDERAKVMEGFYEEGSFSDEERACYKRIIKDFLAAQGTDMRDNMRLISVKKEHPPGYEPRFRLDLTRYGEKGYQELYLDGTWG